MWAANIGFVKYAPPRFQRKVGLKFDGIQNLEIKT
jgi:hypothetical protein